MCDSRTRKKYSFLVFHEASASGHHKHPVYVTRYTLDTNVFSFPSTVAITQLLFLRVYRVVANPSASLSLMLMLTLRPNRIASLRQIEFTFYKYDLPEAIPPLLSKNRTFFTLDYSYVHINVIFCAILNKKKKCCSSIQNFTGVRSNIPKVINNHEQNIFLL